MKRLKQTTQDQETRKRILETAVRLFAERGFKRVTVRDICNEAGANVASVNYHFRDKLGLYTEVIRAAIEEMRRASLAAMEAGEGGSAEDKLRAHVRIFLGHILEKGRPSWIHKLMVHELAAPTPALDIVYEEAVRPRLAYLSKVVSDLTGLPPSDERVRRCINSIEGQCIVYIRNTLGIQYLPMPGPSEIVKIAQHIAEFSIGGIRAIARKKRGT